MNYHNDTIVKKLSAKSVMGLFADIQQLLPADIPQM